jgi:small-conductance mechanosensitive channel
MTEFEEMTIELMQSERIGNVLSLLQGQSELIANDATNFSTILFGYLIAAYFIGAQLTRPQVTILNVLYLATVISTLAIMAADFAGLMGYWGSANRYMEELERSAVTNDTSIVTVLSGEFFLLGMVINTALVIASLYFMWSIRHPKTE